MNLKIFLLKIGQEQLKQKKIYPGHNGPYDDKETPIRNYGHWLITFSKCYELTKNEEFKNKVKELAKYFLSKEARPGNASFYHRKNRNKDKCNGLIGQAWSIEALVRASEILNNDRYLRLAEEIFESHSFNKKLGLWYKLSIKGKILNIDKTFNHQLWFAACGSLILKKKKNRKIKSKINIFINELDNNMKLMNSGLIFHPIKRKLNPKENKRLLSKEFFNFLKKIKGNLKNIYKSKGYQTFNLYGFALMKKYFDKNKFWKSWQLKNSLKYILKDNFNNYIEDNKYSYPYNAPGFEIPYILYVFRNYSKNSFKVSQDYFQNQINKTFNSKTWRFDKNTPDPYVLTARVYEITRLPKKWLEIIKIKI